MYRKNTLLVIQNCLVNADKSDVLVCGIVQKVWDIESPSLQTVNVAGAILNYSSEVKSLGMIIDSKLTFEKHVKSIVNASNVHLHAFRHVRQLLPDDVARTVGCAIAMSRLDYCNLILYDGTNLQIK